MKVLPLKRTDRAVLTMTGQVWASLLSAIETKETTIHSLKELRHDILSRFLRRAKLPTT